MAHQPGANPGFHSMKQLGVFLLPPEWDASPLQGYPQHLLVSIQLYTRVKKGTVRLQAKNTTQCHWVGLKPRLLIQSQVY